MLLLHGLPFAISIRYSSALRLSPLAELSPLRRVLEITHRNGGRLRIFRWLGMPIAAEGSDFSHLVSVFHAREAVSTDTEV